MLRLTGLLLLASLPALAKPTVIYLEWREFQKMADLIQFRPKVTVFTGEHGQERIRGKFTGIYDSGIAFAKKGTRQPLIKRENVHSVRMSPRRGNPQKWRVIAGIAAFPLWFVGINLGLAIPGGIPAGGTRTGTSRKGCSWDSECQQRSGCSPKGPTGAADRSSSNWRKEGKTRNEGTEASGHDPGTGRAAGRDSGIRSRWWKPAESQ